MIAIVCDNCGHISYTANPEQIKSCLCCGANEDERYIRPLDESDRIDPARGEMIDTEIPLWRE